MDLGILLTSDADIVQAKMRANGENYRADIRLKGDWTDHLARDQWSFRVEVKGNNCIYGLQKFSLQRPEVRKGIWEWMIYEMYRELNGVTLRYDFADVYINGVYKGVFAIEEFMEKRVIENSSKREGPIIRMTEDWLWESRAFYHYIDPNDIWYKFNDVAAFSNKKTVSSDLLSGYAQYAIDQLSAFIENPDEAEITSIFDVNQFAQWHAVVDLFSAYHGRFWHNMRFYFNPVTALLEPIPFDENSREIYNISIQDLNWYQRFSDSFFKDKNHNRIYRETLRKIINDYPAFVKTHQKQIDQFVLLIRRDKPSYSFNPYEYDPKINILQQMLDGAFEPAIYAYCPEKEDLCQISFNNVNHIPMVIIGLNNNNSQCQLYADKELGIENELKPGELKTQGGNDLVFYIAKKGCLPLNNATVEWKNAFSEKTITTEVKDISTGFYVIGHAYVAHVEEENGIHQPVKDFLPKIADDFSIQRGFFTGDIVYQVSDSSIQDFIEAVHFISGKPFTVIPGNHDEFPADGYDTDELFLKYFGRKFGYEVDNDNLMLFLDPDNEGWNISREQIDMMAQVIIDNPSARNVFVFSHQLIWWEEGKPERFDTFSPNAGRSYGVSNFSDEVLPLFDNMNVPVYFIAGDCGAWANGNELFYEKDGRFTYMCSGCGGGVKDSALEFRIDSDGEVMIDLIALNGKNPDALGKISDYVRGSGRQ